jgi:hypothetical protein
MHGVHRDERVSSPVFRTLIISLNDSINLQFSVTSVPSLVRSV